MVRLSYYLLFWLIASATITGLAVLSSKLNMENDPSSMAWVGFLPFIFPLFMAQALIGVIPVIIVIETILFFRKGR